MRRNKNNRVCIRIEDSALTFASMRSHPLTEPGVPRKVPSPCTKPAWLPIRLFLPEVAIDATTLSWPAAFSDPHTFLQLIRHRCHVRNGGSPHARNCETNAAGARSRQDGQGKRGADRTTVRAKIVSTGDESVVLKQGSKPNVTIRYDQMTSVNGPGFSTGAIVGITVGIAVAAAAIVVAVIASHPSGRPEERIDPTRIRPSVLRPNLLAHRPAPL